MKKPVKVLSYNREPSMSGFFRAWLTAGIADWPDIVTFVCGHCGMRTEDKIPSRQRFVTCNCCSFKNLL